MPTVIADGGAANGASMTKPGLYGACVWMTSKRRSRNSFFIFEIIRKSSVCSVCDALPYSRRAWPIRTISNGASRETGAGSVVGYRRRAEEIARDDRHLVAAGAQVGRLPVHVLGDPAELRVVVVRQDGDTHGPEMLADSPSFGTV